MADIFFMILGGVLCLSSLFLAYMATSTRNTARTIFWLAVTGGVMLTMLRINGNFIFVFKGL